MYAYVHTTVFHIICSYVQHDTRRLCCEHLVNREGMLIHRRQNKPGTRHDKKFDTYKSKVNHGKSCSLFSFHRSPLPLKHDSIQKVEPSPQQFLITQQVLQTVIAEWQTVRAAIQTKQDILYVVQSTCPQLLKQADVVM